ncbi:hypothetical protein BC830DRAFT_413534 [Chytriomyces sp. MP71]|nr:hypothetical protein BC830DRAFT_413534 [Chytriomyces sp. MP71]
MPPAKSGTKRDSKKRIPQLKDYDINPFTGFLPFDPLPLTRLPKFYEAWELVLDDLQRLLLAGRFRDKGLAACVSRALLLGSGVHLGLGLMS